MKTEKKRTLKGSILFTVVSVLALMVIFMTSALALAAAANKRAHKTYEASQASYTARSAIDSILAAIGTNNEFANAVDSLPQNGKFEVEVGINSPALGRIEKATVEYAGTTNIFDPVSKIWVEKNLIKITAEVTMGGETTKLVSHVIQDPVTKTDDGPGFLTMGDSDASNHGTQWGGSYYGMGIGAPSGTHEEEGTIMVTDNQTWNGGLNYIKYTCIGDVGDLTTLQDKKYLTNKNFGFQNNNVVEAPLVVNGNLNANTQVDIYYTQLGKGTQIWGDLVISNTSFKLISSSELKNQLAASSKRFNQVPYLYVDQKLATSQSVELGDDSFPLNIFCGSFDFSQNGPKICADIYCMDKDETSHYSTTGSRLYSWTDSLLNGGAGYSSTGGNIYSKGNLVITNAAEKYFAGSVRVEGNVEISGGTKIDGDLVVGGKLTIGTGNLTVGKEIYADYVEGTNVSTVGAGALKPGYADVIQCVIGKNVYIGDDYYQYIWLKSTVFNEYVGYYNKIDDNAYDFGNIEVDAKYLPTGFDITEGLVPPTPSEGEEDQPEPPVNPGPDLKQVKTCPGYIKIDINEEVPVSEAISSGDIMYGSKVVHPLADFYAKEQTIYPAYAEKTTILGLSGPVKGTEGHLARDYGITSLPSEVYEDGNRYNGSGQVVGHITKSCTLTGSFTRSVTIDADGTELYVLIQDAVFQNEDDPAEARIYVNETNGGKVYFAFDGKVTSGYKNPAEKEETQVLDTVFDVMTTWQIEGNVRKPAGGNVSDEIHGNGVDAPPDVNASDVTVNGNEISINGVSVKLTGSFKSQVIKITPPSTGSIWIQLDNTFFDTGGNGDMIIIEDVGDDGSKIGGTVNFYITGTVTWKKWHLVTRSFLNAFESGKEYQVVSDTSNSYIVKSGVEFLPAPNVNIYSDSEKQDAVLNCSDGSTFFTAYFRAPYLTLNGCTESNEYDGILSRLYYDGVLLSDAGFQQMAVVGCLNVKKYTGQNNWSLLYIKDTEGGNVILDANKQHTYAAVSYIDY